MTCNAVIEYIKSVEAGIACKDQKLLAQYIRRCFKEEDIYIDEDQLKKYLGLVRYFPYDKLFEWEAFCIALHLCTYWRKNNLPRWPDLFLLIGRGAGKDGFIALESMMLVSPYNPIREYDIDICATAEDVAMRPVEDILGVFEDTRYNAKMKRHFSWTKEEITGIKYRGTIKGRTNNPKSKDGMRSGMVVFNEVHQYENYKNIKVFITSLGKKPHPRRLYATSNGDIRDGPLDDLLARGEQILNGRIGDNGLLPFICRLDNKDEVDNPELWIKANPSLPYLPELNRTINKEYTDWKLNPIANADFMTKRMNLPQSDATVCVTDWENIIATNREMPDLRGWACTCGIDYASISDLASVNLNFKKEDMRFWINHSWLCLKSKDLHRLQVPWREWAALGYITLVDDIEIHPDIICDWILKKGQEYIIKQVAVDGYRYALLAKSLKNIGFDANDKNIKLTRPSDVMKVQPVINSMFLNHNLIAGDNPPLRWAINNTKLLRNTSGSFYYGKIEEKSRKTDPFMAGVHSMAVEDILDTGASVFEDIPIILG